MNIKILMFEDTTSKVKPFEEYLKLRFETELSCKLSLEHRTDDSMLETDLMTQAFHLILIDDDLGNDLSGSTIIETIVSITDTTPEISNVPKIYYSAGTQIDELREKSRKFGEVKCSTYDNLSDTVFNTIQIRYFNK